MTTHTLRLLVPVSSLILLISSCGGPAAKQETDQAKEKQVCAESSEWKDNDGPDYCSYYTGEQSCEKIIGRLHIVTRLHKNLYEKGIFEGGMSSRQLEIKDDLALYFDPAGGIADRGTCHCEDGVLTIDWKLGDNLPEECTIYFRSADSVELRYYDYPYSFDNFQYDTTKPKSNPTKILGTME